MVLSASSFSFTLPTSKYFSERIAMPSVFEGSTRRTEGLANSLSGAGARSMLAPGFEPGAKPIPGCGGWAAVGVKDGVPEGWTSGEEEDEAAGLRASIFTAEDLFVTGV